MGTIKALPLAGDINPLGRPRVHSIKARYSLLLSSSGGPRSVSSLDERCQPHQVRLGCLVWLTHWNSVRGVNQGLSYISSNVRSNNAREQTPFRLDGGVTCMTCKAAICYHPNGKDCVHSYSDKTMFELRSHNAMSPDTKSVKKQHPYRSK